MYADEEAQCQVYHMCFQGRKQSFLCGVGTVFNQAILGCDYWHSVECSRTKEFYSVNEELGKPGAEPSSGGGNGQASAQVQARPRPQAQPQPQPQPQPQRPRPRPQPQPQPQPRPQSGSYGGARAQAQAGAYAPAPAPQSVPQYPRKAVPRPYQPSGSVQPQPQVQPIGAEESGEYAAESEAAVAAPRPGPAAAPRPRPQVPLVIASAPDAPAAPQTAPLIANGKKSKYRAPNNQPQSPSSRSKALAQTNVNRPIEAESQFEQVVDQQTDTQQKLNY